jgi:dihydrofolate synthase / folylpolyglutamate synthase
MQFDEALGYLLSLGHETLTIKLGLRNTELLLDALGNPQTSYPSVQIAGTNGKGSTAVVLDSICRAAGIKTGLFTSPHLVSITERIKIDGRVVSEAEFPRLATEVRRAAEGLFAGQHIDALPTFFEHVTAIALLAFAQAKVDLAILETGLGGRLDSTTAARAEMIAVTPIALDHQEYLGETLAEIAAEKAAIIHPGVTTVVAKQPAAALAVILDRCRDCGVTPRLDDCAATVLGATEDGRLRAAFVTSRRQYQEITLGLRGRHQITNVSLAIRLAESLAERGFKIFKCHIVRGVETANHPGRLELIESRPRVLFDGAHNPAAAQSLRDFLNEFVHTPVTLVFGAMRDKDLTEMAKTLFPLADYLILTQPNNARAASLDSLEGLARSLVDFRKIALERDAKLAFQIARELTSAAGMICITGSLYLIGEVQSALRSESTDV